MKLPYNHNLFVDREDEIKAIMDTVSSLVANEQLNARTRIFHVSGHSNVGKSWFLHECHNRLIKNQKVLSIFVNLEDLAMRSTVTEFVLGLLGFVDNEASNTLHIKSPFTKDLAVNINAYRDWVEGIIEQVQEEKVVVFFFDEINVLSHEQTQALEDYLLAGLLYRPNLVFILTGRYPIFSWKDFGLRPREHANYVELSSFDLEKTVRQLESRKRGSEHLAEKIIALGGGSPGNNETILEQASGDPLEIKDELKAIQACNKDLVESIEIASRNLPEDVSSNLLPALEALCVLEDFDRDEEAPVMLKVHNKPWRFWDKARLNLLFSALDEIVVGPGRLINVDVQNGTYVIDELMRANIERELMLRDNKLWQVLHCTAMNMYQQWADKYESDIFAEKAEYHMKRLKIAGLNPADCEVESRDLVS